jgi:hypothetical protein
LFYCHSHNLIFSRSLPELLGNKGYSSLDSFVAVFVVAAFGTAVVVGVVGVVAIEKESFDPDLDCTYLPS